MTFALTTDDEIAGKSFDFLVAHEGGSEAKAKASEFGILNVSATAWSPCTGAA